MVQVHGPWVIDRCIHPSIHPSTRLQDIKVQLAVHELKKRKDAVVAMQKKVEDAIAASKAAFDDEDD